MLFHQLIFLMFLKPFFLLNLCVREDDKNSVDIHDNPPAPENVVREDGDTVSDGIMSTTHY